MTQVSRRGPAHHPKLKFVLVVLVIAGLVAGASAAVFLSQQVPASTVPPATVSSTCSALTTGSPVTASSGAIQYTCSGGPAFTTIAGSSTYGLTGYTSCPSVVTSPCYSNLGYVAHGDT